jgi:hypothetical protein
MSNITPDNCGNRRYKGIKKPMCFNGRGCKRCDSVYKAAHKKTTKTCPPKSAETRRGEQKVIDLSAAFGRFQLLWLAIPRDIANELRDSMFDYAGESGDAHPIHAISECIQEWLDSEYV